MDNSFSYRKKILRCSFGELDVFLRSTPDSLPSDCADVIAFVCLGERWKRGCFFCYPPENKKKRSEWTRPVEWTDDLCLFVPSLGDGSILRAIQYLIEENLYESVLEDSNTPVGEAFVGFDEVPEKFQGKGFGRPQADQIRLNVFNSLLLLKLSGKGCSKEELRSELMNVVNSVLDENSFGEEKA